MPITSRAAAQMRGACSDVASLRLLKRRTEPIVVSDSRSFSRLASSNSVTAERTSARSIETSLITRESAWAGPGGPLGERRAAALKKARARSNASVAIPNHT